MSHKEIFHKTITKWGEQAQSDQAIEECAELITVLKHYRRGKVDSQAVIEELADVFLIVGQLIYMFGEDKVSTAIEAKLEKLNTLLEK